MPREITVENYLVREFRKIGIVAHKFATPGRRHAPDRICLEFPGQVFFVECKAPGKKPRPGQAREHDRLRALGFEVLLIDTKAKVDQFVKENPCDS